VRDDVVISPFSHQIAILAQHLVRVAELADALA
jgi:hypothetical protein